MEKQNRNFKDTSKWASLFGNIQDIKEISIHFDLPQWVRSRSRWCRPGPGSPSCRCGAVGSPSAPGRGWRGGGSSCGASLQRWTESFPSVRPQSEVVVWNRKIGTVLLQHHRKRQNLFSKCQVYCNTNVLQHYDKRQMPRLGKACIGLGSVSGVISLQHQCKRQNLFSKCQGMHWIGWCVRIQFTPI